jgi:hypothetical protein
MAGRAGWRSLSMRPLQSWRLPKGSAGPISAAFCAHPARPGHRRACSERGGRRLGSRGSCSRDPSTAAIDRDIRTLHRNYRGAAPKQTGNGDNCASALSGRRPPCAAFSIAWGGQPPTSTKYPPRTPRFWGWRGRAVCRTGAAAAGQRAVRGALHRAGSAGVLRRAAPACLRRAGGWSGACGYRGSSEPC